MSRPGSIYIESMWFYFIFSFISQKTLEIESIRFLGPKTCEIIPATVKEVDTTECFKSVIKKRNPESCPCRLWKTYLQKIKDTCRLNQNICQF